ncbi:hypothetical protein RJ639_029521 [Escallonia herrerae]|uniref:Transposase n=1 Tax=Escallonia herrerae TaxID=1293975 RepID=A0AA88UWW4_9ASTE|nr:hypothetical protein RJ639_029521 [Escallonia herrerae]
MDKSWMNQRRTSSAYFEGVEEFLDFAFANASVDGEIICPCNVCGNSIWVSRIGARGHLICNGFIKGYTKWVAHGEVKSSAAPLSRAHVALDVIDDMRGLLHDRFHMSSDEVLELYLAGDKRISEELRILARGPNEVVTRYKGFIINGFRFHIKELEQNRKTQNSGLVVNAMTPSFSSARDDNPILGDLTYYGVLEEIIELQYSGSKRVVLFRSNWVSKGSRKKEDENGFTLLNFKRLTRHKEPFVLASQVQQVFYTEDVGGWHVVIKTTARDAFDMNAVASEDDVETYLQSEPCNAQEHDRDEDVSWVREGVQGTIINMN